MSKICNFKFDNEDLQVEFLKLLPAVGPDISSFLRSGLEVKGIMSDPEIIVDSEQGTVTVKMFASNKGNVLSLGDDVVYQDYSEVSEDALYALFNPRTKNIEVYVKRDPIDVILGQYASFKALDEGWEAITIPPKPEDLSEDTFDEVEVEAEMKVVEDEESVDETPADKNE